MSDPVVAEVVIAAPADAVWRALREPAEIRRWFGWDYDGLDAEIEFIFERESDRLRGRPHARRRRGRAGSPLEAVAESGDEWFSSEHQRGEVLADGSLVIRTPERTIVSRYVS